MGKSKIVKVSDLLFWLDNFRFEKAESQDDAFEKLRKTDNFKALVDSIKEHDLQGNETLTVSPDDEESGKYRVYDGNRRLAAIKENSSIETIRVWVEDKPSAKLEAILSRAHISGDPAGQLKWTPVQQARRDKLLFNEKIKSNLSGNAVALNIIEKATGEELANNFPITTFDRLFRDPEFCSKFEIDSNRMIVGKKDEIKKVIRDINDKKINSRSLNTKSSRLKYIDSLFDKKAQKSLSNGSEHKGKKQKDSDQIHLLGQPQLDELEALIENPYFIKELKRARIDKYPHLLFFSLRAILDTLENILHNPRNPRPGALSADDAEKYLHQHEKNYKNKVWHLVDNLAAHAHDVRKQSTKGELKNNRPHFEILIERMIKKIKEKQSTSDEDKK